MEEGANGIQEVLPCPLLLFAAHYRLNIVSDVYPLFSNSSPTKQLKCSYKAPLPTIRTDAQPLHLQPKLVTENGSERNRFKAALSLQGPCKTAPKPVFYQDQAFVTLTTNDAYAKGALVLGSSLKHHRTTRRLVVLATPQVSDSMRKVLETVFDEVVTVDVLDSGDSAHLTLMKRPELGVTLTKLHCWSLTQYSKCVFMDADTLVLANIDDLFEREELSAAPDPGWPDCFNSGVFVYQPSVETYSQLLNLAAEQGSFDGGDQGLLNTFFSSWATTDIRKHLPFIYNLSSISIYSYLPAFKAFGANTKVVHFLGRVKPWNYTYDPQTKSVKSESDDPTMTHPEFLNLWWDIFTTNVLPLLQRYGLVKDTCSYKDVEHVSGAVSHLSLGENPAAPQPSVSSSEDRKERWEQGQADYMGADSFDNIKQKLDTYLQ
ncbi:Glycogenin-1 [Fukomys damarensis]|uniref:Glycogenin-1 n=1 Tax=Fukomys damarensis TaxID=885580 RepID=A0A091DKZ5_FUKDA|nr:Glycogenin-1 [Fukomys damarensis]